jgi:hypothetical protein
MVVSFIKRKYRPFLAIVKTLFASSIAFGEQFWLAGESGRDFD